MGLQGAIASIASEDSPVLDDPQELSERLRVYVPAADRMIYLLAVAAACRIVSGLMAKRLPPRKACRILQAGGLTPLESHQVVSLLLEASGRGPLGAFRPPVSGTAKLFVVLVSLIVSAIGWLGWNIHEARLPGQRLQIELPGGEVLRLVRLTSGVVFMGATADDGAPSRQSEVPRTEVTLTQPFWIGETEVTQSQWQAMMGTTQERLAAECGTLIEQVALGPKFPVVCVSAVDAEAYCARLTRLLGGERIAMLPSEAQWEYACRAGSTTPYHFGGGINETRANYLPVDKSYNDAKVKSVAQLTKNRWGLFDMHGNVAEWTRGGAASYPGGAATDWMPPEQNTDRVVRGGAFDMPYPDLRSAARGFVPASTCRRNLGFRVLVVDVSN